MSSYDSMIAFRNIVSEVFQLTMSVASNNHKMAACHFDTFLDSTLKMLLRGEDGAPPPVPLPPTLCIHSDQYDVVVKKEPRMGSSSVVSREEGEERNVLVGPSLGPEKVVEVLEVDETASTVEKEDALEIRTDASEKEETVVAVSEQEVEEAEEAEEATEEQEEEAINSDGNE